MFAVCASERHVIFAIGQLTSNFLKFLLFFFIGHISLHVFWTLIMILYIEWPSVNSNEVQFNDQIKVL